MRNSQLLYPTLHAHAIELGVVKIYPDVQLPTQAHTGDAGFDVKAYLTTNSGYSNGQLVIEPGQRTLVPTGIKLKIPFGHEVQVRPRSGLSLKTDMIIPNSPGTIDQGYQGECCVIVFNAGTKPLVINHGERIAQFVLNQLPYMRITEISEEQLGETERSNGGFGSTGVF